MMSISAQGRVRFCIFFLNGRSVGHETLPPKKYSHGQYFQEKSCMVWRRSSTVKALLDSLTYHNYSKEPTMMNLK